MWASGPPAAVLALRPARPRGGLLLHGGRLQHEQPLSLCRRLVVLRRATPFLGPLASARVTRRHQQPDEALQEFGHHLRVELGPAMASVERLADALNLREREVREHGQPRGHIEAGLREHDLERLRARVPRARPGQPRHTGPTAQQRGSHSRKARADMAIALALPLRSAH